MKSDSFECQFCNKSFKKDSTLLSHKCVKRDRYNNRETRAMKVAIDIWHRFMDYNKLTIPKKESEFMYFIKSSVFNDFYKFSEYLTSGENEVLDPDKFIDHVIKNGIPAIRWCTESLKTEWVIQYTKAEHPTKAISRCINALLDWEQLTGYEWNSFMDKCSPYTFMVWIQNGKLSPWILYATNNPHKILQRLSDSELDSIYPFIDHTIWIPKQSHYMDDVEHIRNELKGVNL